jgi:hypothetical protein
VFTARRSLSPHISRSVDAAVDAGAGLAINAAICASQKMTMRSRHTTAAVQSRAFIHGVTNRPNARSFDRRVSSSLHKCRASAVKLEKVVGSHFSCHIAVP